MLHAAALDRVSTRAKSAASLADVIREHREQIVLRFVGETARILSPSDVPRPLLVDHIPAFLDKVARELEVTASVREAQGAMSAKALAREHGEQRWSLGFDLQAVIREYGLLRRCIAAVATDVGCAPNATEYEILADCLELGVAAASAAYTQHRDREVAAERERLEFLAEAGQLLSSSLDYLSTTSRLTGLVVPRMADWCVLHLEGVDVAEAPVAHVDPSKLALVRERYVELLPTTASDIRGDETAARTPEQLAFLNALGTTSYIVVPLLIQSQTFGALTLGYSVSARHYGEIDFELAKELGRRAASAIDNARLFALSQTERARVEAATRAKDEFVAMVSHELRTPLNAMLGWLRLMRSGMIDEARRQHAFDVIERNAEAQDRLVADLLDISRILTGKLRVKPSQVDLSDVVEIAVEAMRPAADAKRIQMNLELDRDHSVLRGDAERLEQVVWNLVGNAVKFTPKGGTVTVRLRRVESDLELVVEDDGEGIEPSFLPYVFEIFQQSDRSSSRPHGGLGIGLSIVKHIVDLHGGAIRASSAGKGTGATFSVRLPISTLISSTLGISRVVPATSLPRDMPALPTGIRDLRVLVVEDDPDARELVTVVLESSGMEVRTAETVAEALAILESYSPTVLCSDIGLLDQDGYVLIRSIRAHADASRSKIPAIALTAYGANEDRKRALVEGFNVHLTKPVEPARLIRTILELAGRQNALIS